MIDVELLPLALAVVFALMVLVWVTVAPWRRLIRKRVVIVLTNDETVRGVLLRRHGPLLTLGAGEVLAKSGPVSVDGDMVIERSQVRWIQVVR